MTLSLTLTLTLPQPLTLTLPLTQAWASLAALFARTKQRKEVGEIQLR